MNNDLSFDMQEQRAPPLSEQAYQKIKKKILSLALRPGLFLNLADLCELTGLGRMPVHQAIQRLSAEGLIEIIPRKGLIVRFDTVHDVLSLLEARLVIEPEVVALAAERISSEQLQVLHTVLQTSRTFISPMQRESFAQLDHTFHSLLSQAAGNSFLLNAQRSLLDRPNMMWHLRVAPEDDLLVTQVEHEAIYHAVAQHNAQGAREAMRAHLLSLRKRII